MDLFLGDRFQFQLAPVPVRQNHLEKTPGISRLDVMKQDLAREPEVAAVTHAIEVGILRPLREIPGKSTLPHKLVEMPCHRARRPLQMQTNTRIAYSYRGFVRR